MSTIRRIDVLVLCTGNQCRSPMGEVLLRERLATRAPEARVSSAGLLNEGAVASAGSVRAMGKRGLDLADHRSRRVTNDDVARADLVIGMAREHVREAVVLEPGALERSFTLRELVRRGDEAGPRRALDLAMPEAGLEPIDMWLERLGQGRRASDLLGVSPDDDIADPMGMSRRAYERTARQIEELVDRLVDLAFPVAVTQSSYST